MVQKNKIIFAVRTEKNVTDIYEMLRQVPGD